MNRAQWLVFKAHDAEWQEREKKAAPVKERKRAYLRAYLQRPEVEERKRAYLQRPEVKERKRVYMRAYWKERRRMLALAKKEGSP